MEKKSCAIQFTGGRDSTLTLILLADVYGFNDIHLLTFKTDLTIEVDKCLLNVQKLEKQFGSKVNIVHRVIDSQDLLIELIQKSYFSNIWSYKSFNAATFCPSCRLSHHIHSIIYCNDYEIMNLADGVNELTGYDMLQQGWAVEYIRGLYKEYGINYLTPLLHSKISSEKLLEKYCEELGMSDLLFESQPKCLGGGQFHNLYLRCFYLPAKGKQAYQEISQKWIQDKLPMVKKHIAEHKQI